MENIKNSLTSELDSGIRVQTHRSKEEELQSQAYFNKVAITEVKKRLGSNCTYLSHYTKGSEIGFLAHIKVKGKKNIVRVVVDKKDFGDIEADDYKSLHKKLVDYVGSKENL